MKKKNKKKQRSFKVKNKSKNIERKKSSINQPRKRFAQEDKSKKQDNVEYQEREYLFDERLVPYILGGDSKEGNLIIRNALIKLGKTSAMTDLFNSMKVGNLSYRDNAMDIFIKALLSIIKGHDRIGLLYVNEEDIKAIHEHNLKRFNEQWQDEIIHYININKIEGLDN